MMKSNQVIMQRIVIQFIFTVKYDLDN